MATPTPGGSAHLKSTWRSSASSSLSRQGRAGTQLDLGSPQVNIITQARALSMRLAYALRRSWSEGCSLHFVHYGYHGIKKKMLCMVVPREASLGKDFAPDHTHFYQEGRDLHVFSTNGTCLKFWSGYSHVTLRSRPGYVSKVPTTHLRVQVVNLQVLPPEEADLALTLLCPGSTDGECCPQVEVAHWVVDASPWLLVSPLYEVLLLLGVVHSASLTDILEAGQATPITCARFFLR
ncbi:Protein POF1B [Labeo rohita]|uniref:Protein POF1B n=1 Tax=Labeo rohita TaxID=84645 RepID=A0ABQ8LP32_LABRO|nr:Protein POF1B [Labeo rohita]